MHSRESPRQARFGITPSRLTPSRLMQESYLQFSGGPSHSGIGRSGERDWFSAARLPERRPPPGRREVRVRCVAFGDAIVVGPALDQARATSRLFVRPHRPSVVHQVLVLTPRRRLPSPPRRSTHPGDVVKKKVVRDCRLLLAESLDVECRRAHLRDGSGSGCRRGPDCHRRHPGRRSAVVRCGDPPPEPAEELLHRADEGVGAPRGPPPRRCPAPITHHTQCLQPPAFGCLRRHAMGRTGAYGSDRVRRQWVVRDPPHSTQFLQPPAFGMGTIPPYGQFKRRSRRRMRRVVCTIVRTNW